MKPPQQRPEIIANRVRMKRQRYHKAVFLLVEGDDDKKLYERFFDSARCRIQTAYGRPNVEAALTILEADSTWDRRVLGIVDADFDILEGRAADRHNLLRTDTHDAETMMLKSPALEHVLREHGDEDAITKLEAATGQTLREHLLNLARVFGALRWIATRKKLGLRFEDLRFARVIDKKTWTLIRDKVVDELQSHSQAGVLDADALNGDAEEVLSSEVDLWQLCCGHDMVAILAIGLQNVLGKRNPAEVKARVLEKDLRLAYETVYFASTELCRALRRWERHNGAILYDELRVGKIGIAAGPAESMA